MHEAPQSRLAHNAMTGDDERNGIAAASLANGLRTGADLCGQLTIALRLATGDVQHRLPHIALVMRAVEFERQVDLMLRISQIGFQFSADRFGHFARWRLKFSALWQEFDAQQIRVGTTDTELAEGGGDDGLEFHARIISEM